MFSSRLKDAYFEAKIENATLKLQVEAAREIADRSTKDAEKWQTEALKLAGEKFRLETDKAVLLERLDLLANHLPPAPTQAFNHISEEQEDADYALSIGSINRDEYEAILASAGALNTELSFDSDSPRL